jgi:phosphoribosyl-ATP pyrophosphohydrolase/phosphoribosyl-AMP cyclohydrolase
MKPERIHALDWDKGDGLLPAVVQHATTGRVLMVGYMNREALERTLESRRVTFYSRSRQSLWTKGETSGHFLDLVGIAPDCDDDALLVLAEPNGPTCHKGTQSCFGDWPATIVGAERYAFLARLENVIAQRVTERPEGSYTARLWSQGPKRIAQKVGEEGVEVAMAGVDDDDEALVSEAADLLYHLTLLMKSRDLSLTTVVEELARRHRAKA